MFPAPASLFPEVSNEFLVWACTPFFRKGYGSGSVIADEAEGRIAGMRRILIIDDEADIREVASLALEVVAGWHVITAASGAQGLAIARSELPDAILLDVMMPAMDGPSTFAMLRNSTELSGIPVVFLTAKVQPAEYRQLAAFGASGILAKPFDPLTLAQDLSRALGWSLQSFTQIPGQH